MNHPFPLSMAVALCFALLGPAVAAAEKPQKGALDYKIKVDTVLQHDDRKTLWYHPRVTAIPGHGRDKKPGILLTLQKHLAVSDHYSGVYWMWSDDLGKTWTKPVGPPELDWRKESDQVDIAVADVTPGWHARTRKALAIGIKVRYNKAGAELLDKPRSWEFAYAVFDPAKKKWTPWRMLAVPGADTKFYIVGPGCCQWVIKDDGTLLVPAYFRGPKPGRFSTTVFHCSFDGKRVKYLAHGDEITINDGRGIYEPSLVRFGGKYYLTLRNDSRGYVTVSDNGLRYKPIKPWTFDDGKALGSYNTQQHWLAHSDGLCLVYTRSGANNNHIMRHRAPLFIAQVDPDKLHVVGKTERVLIPERGAELGNFGAAAINASESWVTVAEGVWDDKARKRGAKGASFVARVLWSRPNKAAGGPK